MKNRFVIAILLLTCLPALSKNNPFIKEPQTDSTAVFSQFLRSQFTSYCEPQIHLNTIEANTIYLYQAANYILTDGGYQINAEADKDIRMKAGFQIILKPDTRVYKGNHYLARIEPCSVDGCTNLRQEDIPKGLSPNGDLKNDIFDLSDFCIDQLKIFNRYGLEVYVQNNYTNHWHGQSDKGDLPTGTYFYVITLTTGKK